MHIFMEMSVMESNIYFSVYGIECDWSWENFLLCWSLWDTACFWSSTLVPLSVPAGHSSPEISIEVLYRRTWGCLWTCCSKGGKQAGVSDQDGWENRAWTKWKRGSVFLLSIQIHLIQFVPVLRTIRRRISELWLTKPRERNKVQLREKEFNPFIKINPHE